MTSQASLSLSLLLTKVTHAQYRKRFRASYNSAALPFQRPKCNLVHVVKVFSYADDLRPFVRIHISFVINRGLFQRLSGFETGHPSAAGPLPAFDFSCFRRARRCFSRLRYGLIWLRFIRFGFSKLKLEHCSSKGVLEKKKKKTPSKREKAELLEREYLHRRRQLESFFVFYFFSLSFLLLLFLFSSSPACYAHTSHLISSHLHFFITSTIFMKLGTLVQHDPGSKILPQIF